MQLVRLTVLLTAGHQGYFEYKLCNKSSASELVTQECLDKNPLKLLDGTTRQVVGDSGIYDSLAWLPKGMTCANCVIQW